jgi:hypothetical protein
MRAWPLHVVFAAILVSSLVAKHQTKDQIAERGSLEPAIIRVARAHGLSLRDYTTTSDTDVSALAFIAPACERPVLVVQLSTTFDQEQVARSAREPGYMTRYVYIDRSWDKADRLAIIAERAKYAVLALVGMTQYMPSWHLLLVESPSDCEAAVGGIDWRLVWNRDYLAASEARSR